MAEAPIVSASGIRGVVGSGMDPSTAARYGAAFGGVLREEGEPAPGERILVGRDSRTSGPILVDAVAAGLRGTGWDVADLGVVTTPTGLLAVQDDGDARGGMLVTASHNPAPWNGLKLAGADGTFVSPGRGRRVQEVFEAGPPWAPWDGLGGRTGAPGAPERHVERILALEITPRDRIAAAGLHVAVDTVRGAAGPVMRRLMAELDCRLEGVDLEPDGRFPREPEPRPENLERLAGAVRGSGADLGMAVDPDGDRLALVDGSGEPLGEDLTLALAVRYVLGRRRGPVVTNLSTSRVVADVAEEAGAEVHLSPVGEANVAGRMREVDAVIGGEGNGGVMVPDLHLTRDAPLAAVLVLGELASSGESLAGLADGLPSYRIAKRRAPRPGGSLEPAYRALLEGAPGGPEADRQDGLRLDWPARRSWVHVRPSGTEPIVRVIAEAPDGDEADRLAEWALETLEAATSERPDS